MPGVQRFLPAFAAILLVAVGVIGAIALLASRDHSSLTPSTPVSDSAGQGPLGLTDGNVVVLVASGADRVRVDQLAKQLGALDTQATRAAGQALVSKLDPSITGVKVESGNATLVAASATDPAVAAFVRQHLGRVGP
jgi:hypothetical protein